MASSRGVNKDRGIVTISMNSDINSRCYDWVRSGSREDNNRLDVEMDLTRFDHLMSHSPDYCVLVDPEV